MRTSSRSQNVLILLLTAVVLAGMAGCGGAGGGGGGSVTTPASVTITQGSSISLDYGQTVNLTATVYHDATNAGVSWSLLGGPGALSNQTKTSVTYTAPASGPGETALVKASAASDTSKSADIQIHVAPVPLITTTSLADGVVGTAYAATLLATGGTAPLTWSLATGSSLVERRGSCDKSGGDR